MKAFPIPVVALGPGSQPVDEEAEFMRLPEMLAAFRCPPRPVDVGPAALAEARAFLAELHAAASRHDFGESQFGQRQCEGRAANAVPGATCANGSPSAGSYTHQHTPHSSCASSGSTASSPAGPLSVPALMRASRAIRRAAAAIR